MISHAYLAQLQQVFKDKSRPNSFGGKIKKLGQFHNYMTKWQPTSLIDYGCGKGIILEHLRTMYPDISIDGYDPAVSMFSKMPSREYECVFSNDVLEHVEPEFVVSVLSHINKLSSKYVWLRIDTIPARKTLLDGRNAHIMLESDDWWYNIVERSIEGRIVYAELDKKGKFDIAIEK